MNGSRILQAEDVYAPRRRDGRTASRPVSEWAFHRYPPVFDARVRPDLSRRGQSVRSTVVQAEVNQGRWVARCPFCPSAQVVSASDPRFICAGADGCANGDARGAFVRVRFPEPDARAALEALLLVRPTVNRNWTPGETLEALREENVANGLDNA